MIRPTSHQLLAGVAAALEDTVLPQLARGTVARRQFQAALTILRRIAFALPGEVGAMEADIEDMEEVLRQAAALWPSFYDGTSALLCPPHQGDGEAESELAARHECIQEKLVDLQNRLMAAPPQLHAQVTPIITDLHKRMADRALAQLPPPRPPKSVA